MQALWRGSRQTQLRIATGLVLFIYVAIHLVNIGLPVLSPAWSDAFQDARVWLVRNWIGSTILYGALFVHAVLALGKVALTSRLRFKPMVLMQVGFGIAIPLLLASHVVFTRISAEAFETHDTVAYLAGLVWGTADGWQQAGLLIITWVHGCIGLHMWLRLWDAWGRFMPLWSALAVLLPAFALAGYASEGRRASGLLNGPEDPYLDFMDATNWPGPGEFATLIGWSDLVWWVLAGVIAVAVVIYGIRQIWRPNRNLKITYVDGPVVTIAPGPTLLEISHQSGIPHTSLCGGKGRCTTCRVLIEDGAGALHPPSASERQALTAVSADPRARLACQLRPKTPATVFRVFQPDGRKRRSNANQGKEAQLAILFLDMRGFTARTTGQLPYDVVFLLNRFFDAIVPPINKAGGTVDKYLGDGLLAVFETEGPESSAKAGLRAAQGIGDALVGFNKRLEAEGQDPVKIGLSLHLGTVVLGEIGAVGQAPRTLIGDTVNTASRLEAETKALGVEGLFSERLLLAAGVETADLLMQSLTLRGVSDPLNALAIPKLTQIDELTAKDPQTTG